MVFTKSLAFLSDNDAVKKCIIAQPQGHPYQRIFFERNGTVVFNYICYKQPYCV